MFPYKSFFRSYVVQKSLMEGRGVEDTRSGKEGITEEQSYIFLLC